MVKFIEVKENDKVFSIKKRGQYLFFLFNFSGNLDIKIESSHCQVFIYGLFVGKNKEKFQLNTVQHHKVGESFSDLLIKGVFFDKSRFSYQGLIRIEKEADKSSAYQKNQNLVLSQNCLVESRPYLEILANDVFCTHGSTTGKLNEQELYYLACRGLPREKAQILLIEGFLGEVFDKIRKIYRSQKINHLYQKVFKKIKC